MSAWARPGVKVVCVDASIPRDFGPWDIVEGSVYEIQGVHLHRGSASFPKPHLVVTLVGLSNWHDLDFGGFALSRFRPLITQEDDVRLIKSLLISNPVDAGLVPAGVELDA